MNNVNNVFQIKYNEFKQLLEELQGKIIELGHDKDEHGVVLETLGKSNPNRKCFRMVGGALVESDVKTTVPILETRRVKLSETLSAMKIELVKTAEEFEKWKKDNKIQVVSQ